MHFSTLTTILRYLDPDSVNGILDAFFRQGANVNAINLTGETPLFKVMIAC